MNRRIRAGAKKVDQKRRMTTVDAVEIGNPNIEFRNKFQ